MPAELDAAIASLRHRGPDDRGAGRYPVSGERTLDLGFARLSILDRSAAGHQPMANAAGTVQLVFNGEITNFRALRTTLAARGHAFRSGTDTECIVVAYEEWGDDFLSHLDGMFALALWDARRERLVLARDRLGIKPLYVSTHGGRLVFGSEIKALLAVGVPRTLDPDALPEYLQLLYLLPPRTFFLHVRQLPPGGRLVWERGVVREDLYWKLSCAPRRRDEREVVEELAALLQTVVREHLESDVPLGVFLSGGLDSSTLLALAARAQGRPVRTFCMTFGAGEGLYDERAYAARVARAFGADHTEVPVRPDVAGLLPALVRAFDQPFGNPTALLSYALAGEVRRHVTVALAGDGGDEVFLGYPRHQGLLLAEQVSRLPRPLRTAAARLSALIPESTRGHHELRRAREFLSTAALPPEEAYASWVGYFTPQEIAALTRRPAPRPALAPLFAETSGGKVLDRAAAVDLRSFLPGNLLAYTDRTSMAHGLEVRVPFCDHRLVELMSGVDAGQRIGKRLLRAAMRGVLPPETLARKKLGFNPPMGLWLAGPLRHLVDELLSRARLERHGLLDASVVARLVEEQRAGRRDRSLHVWSLVVLQAWLESAEARPA